jgi:hypothetical protein
MFNTAGDGITLSPMRVSVSTLRNFLPSASIPAGKTSRNASAFGPAGGTVVAVYPTCFTATGSGGHAMLAPSMPWAVILAGGDGTRLRPLTQRLTGDARPKQFCRLFDGQTLLDQTRRRGDLIIRPDRQLVVSVLRVKDVGWNDLGNPRRAAESARRRGQPIDVQGAHAHARGA